MLTIIIHDGYFQAKSDEIGKLKVEKDDYNVTYNIGTEFENFPFQFGEGKYSIKLYRKLVGITYIRVSHKTYDIRFKNKFSPFLTANQYVRTDLPFLDNISVHTIEDVKKYIERQYVYDYIKVINTPSGLLPDIEGCYSTHRGSCYDLAALTVALLRKINVPAKLMVGKGNNRPHAWVELFEFNSWVFYDPTIILQHIKKDVHYSVERWY